MGTRLESLDVLLKGCGAFTGTLARKPIVTTV